ncbi:MAG: ATP-binding protein [Pseudonocardiaceae bacterium]
MQREVAAREAHGGESRIRAARFPSRKSLEEFDFDHQRSLKRDTITHLGILDLITAKDNVVFLGPSQPEPVLRKRGVRRAPTA